MWEGGGGEGLVLALTPIPIPSDPSLSLYCSSVSQKSSTGYHLSSVQRRSECSMFDLRVVRYLMCCVVPCYVGLSEFQDTQISCNLHVYTKTGPFR